MRKSMVLKIISIISAALAVVAIAGAITVTGSGFLDLSNIVTSVCIVIAVIFGTLAVTFWIISTKR